MANKKIEDFMYRDLTGDEISQDEFEEIILEVLKEEERYSLEEYLNMLEMSKAEFEKYISAIKEQYPQIFFFGKERYNLCRELAKAKKAKNFQLISFLLCDDGILAEFDTINDENLRSFTKYIFNVKRTEAELKERWLIHQKWKKLLQNLHAYTDVLPMNYVAMIDYKEILRVYREIFPQNKMGPYLVQNLEVLADIVNMPPFQTIAPLYIYIRC